eukprot:8581982-Heterocapsa_arctica.AAC.1
MPTGSNLVHAFFIELSNQRYAIDAAEALQKEYGMEELGHVCDRIADALETYLQTPQRNDTERHLVTRYSRELRERALPDVPNPNLGPWIPEP